MKRFPAPHPNGQNLICRVPPPKESHLVNAILEHAAVAFRGLVYLDRAPAGEWIAARRVKQAHGWGLVQTGYITGHQRGHPDMSGYVCGTICDRRGAALYVEAKRDDSEALRPEQREFLERAAAAGAVCILARSVEEFEADLFKLCGLMRAPSGRIVRRSAPIGTA